MKIKKVNKICKVGSSYCVFLPIDWIRFYKLQIGDTVQVVADKIIEIKPIFKEGDKQ